MSDPDIGSVARHYSRDDLEKTVLEALRAVHGDLSGLSAADLHPIDEFHIRGHQATRDLAALLGDLTGLEILDVGCGLGGGARHLASNWDCRVTGIDATPGYVALARELSKLVALSERTDFQCGSALQLPFRDGRFDVVWMQHAQMNMPDKRLLARQLARVLRNGGKLAFHEIFHGARPHPHFPVPWAMDASNSFLAAAWEFRDLLEAEGMRAEHWQDATQPSLKWASKLVERLQRGGPPRLGVHLLMGESAREKLGNMKRSLEEDRIRVVQAVFLKP